MFIIFDIDDTLIDHGAAFGAATRALHRSVALDLPLEQFVSRWTSVHREYYDRYLQGELTYEGQARGRIRAVLETAPDDATADLYFSYYLHAYESAWALFPDVKPCLHALTEHRLGVISNGQRHQQVRKLERTGLARRFDCVLISEECGYPKPRREIFRAACTRAGESPEQALYVGDVYELDAVGARQAGLTGVWLDRQGKASTEHAQPIIRSLLELPDIIARMAADVGGTG